MKDRIQSLISTLEHDSSNEEAIAALGEAVTSDEAVDRIGEVAELLESSWRRLVKNGRFEAACRVMETELALAESPEQEVRLLRELARICDEEIFDQKTALEKYQKILAIAPDDIEAPGRVEAIETERTNWKEIVAKFIEQAEEATEPSLKAHMLYSGAERTYKNHRRGKEIPALLQAAIEADPTHMRAARLYERVLKERERWEDLASFYMKLGQERTSKQERVQMLLAAGYTYGFRLEDMESAALCYSEALDFSPGEPAALKFLVKYYEEKEDWDHLIAVYSDALRGNLSEDEKTAMLMQAGMIHWRMRDNMAEAEVYFRQLRRLHPAHAGMLGFYRKLYSDNESKSRLLQILADAQRATGDKDLHDKLTREIADLAGTEGGNPEKAIDAYKSMLRDDPGNAEVRDKLKILYRQSGKWNNLLDALKSEADSVPDAEIAAKVAVYEEMVAIYRDQLSLEMMVIKTYDQILRLDPDNTDALAQLTTTYQNAGRWNDLINILNRRAAGSADPQEKIALLNRVAGLWVDQFNNLNKAVEPLEEILSLDPSNRQAIETLKGVYQKRRAWRPLLDLLEKEALLLEGQEKRDHLVEMAQLAGDRLSDHDRAVELWHAVLEIDPNTPEALETLEKLAERRKDWPGRAEVLERRLSRAATDEDRVALLTKVGTVWKDRVKDPARAADAWSRLLEVEPGNAKAMRSLKDAYQAASDWDSLEKLYRDAEDFEGLVEVLGIAADRAPDTETKVMLSFKCADLYDVPIGQPDRAVRHYERVLSVDEHNLRASTALAPIYRRAEKWGRLVGVLETVLDATTDAEERILRLDELRELCAVQMNNRALAFKWAARAFEEMPTDEAVRAAAEEAAEAAGAFEELVTIYRSRLDAFEGDALVAMESRIARISLERLGAVEDAIAGYQAVLEGRPGDQGALDALDNIFRTTGQWEELAKVFERRLDLATDDAAKRALMMEMARLNEEGMDRPAKAAAHYRAVLQMFPEDQDALHALERIFRFSEQWDELAEILERRRGLTEIGSEEWREISFQIARLFDSEIGDKPRAIATFKELLDTAPGDPETIEAMEHFLRDERCRVDVARFMEPHLVSAADWRRLAWALAILIESSQDKAERLRLNSRLADVYGDELGDQRVAFDTLGASLRENQDNRELWDRMTALAAPLGLEEELTGRLAEAYEADEIKDEARLELAIRLAALYGEALGEPAKAARFHQKVLDEDSTATGSFAALEEYYTANEQWSDLLGLYRKALDSGSGAATRLDLLLKVCFLVDEMNRDLPAAIDAYRAVLDEDARNPEAIRSLVSLYEEAQRWDDLSSLLVGQLEQVSGAEATALRYRLGEIAEHHLRAPHDAIEHYEQVIGDDPDHLKAQEALERLLETPRLRLRAASILSYNYDLQGAAEPLARVLMIGLEDEELDPAARVEILCRVADIRERRLSDVDGAFEALAAGLRAQPENDFVFREIGRLAAENRMDLECAGLLDGIIPSIEDGLLAARFMKEVARLYDERLGDPDKSRVAYRRLLEHDRENPDTALPAIEALDRLLTGDEAWPDLLLVLRDKARLLGDPMEQKAVLHRMAEIEESLLDRIPNSIDLFREILQIDETDMAALYGLERLYDREGQWPQLVDVLRRRALVEESADMRRDTYLRVARLIEERLDDRDEAIAAYNQVMDEMGPDQESLRALARLYAAAERWSDLHDVYETQEPLLQDEVEKAQMLFLMGDLLRSRLSEPERAVDKLGEALRINPAHREARASLEALLESPVKLEAIGILRPIFEAEGDYERLLAFSDIQARELDDPLERSRVLRDAAEIAEVGLDDPARAFDLLGRAFRDGTTSPDLPALIDNLERVATRVDAHDKLIDLYREVTNDILDGDLQVRCNLRVAQIAHTLFDDVAVAREYYVKVLDMDGENSLAMDALEQIYQSQGLYLELFEIYRKKVQSSTDDDARRDILFKQARICELNLDDISGASQTYETILESDPENADAIEALERLYPKAERWADLMDLLEKRVELKMGDPVELLHNLGRLAHDKLGDDERALEYYARALALNPHHGTTIASLEEAMRDEAQRGRVARILEPVYKQQGDWARLAEALDARLGTCDDPLERKDLLRRIGTVYEEQLGSLEQAFETFSRLFAEDPEDRSSWDLLTRLAAVLENWPRLAQVFAAALDNVVGDTPDTAELAFMLGEIYETRLGKAAEARASYQRVLAFSPDDPRAFLAVERMLLATESWPDLLELYRDAADAAMDTDQRKGFIFKIAEIQESSNEDQDAAINAYRDVMDMDDRDERAIRSLDRLYHQTERFEDLTMHLRAQIDQAPEAAARNDLRRRMARVYEESLHDLTSAVDTFEEALREDGGDAASVAELERLILDEGQRMRIAEILEPIYRETDQWKKLVVILKTMTDFIDVPAQKVERLKEIALLHETRGQNYMLAFNNYAKAFKVDPASRETLSELVRLAEGIENWEDLASTLESCLDEIYDVEFKVGVLHLLGSTYDRRLDVPRKAIEAYNAVIGIDETDVEALDALEGLFNLVGEWEGLVEVLAKKATLSADDAVRAEILRTKASIHEDLMGAPRDAIDSYRQALEADPTSLVTMDALERLYEAAGEWVELIEVRRQRLEALSEPSARADVLRSIGPIYEEKLNDSFEAITAWRAVTDEDPRDATAVLALDRLFTKESVHAELLENLKLQKEIVRDQAAWVEIGVRIGGLQENELSDLEGAIDSYRDVLAQQPTHAAAIGALERLARDESVRARAIEVLEPLHRDAGRNDRLAEIVELKLGILSDPAARLEELLSLAQIHDVGRSDPSAAFGVYARALAEDPGRTDIMDALDRIAAGEGLWRKLAEVYEKQAENVYEPEAERAILSRLGEIREVHLQDPKGAIDAYRRIMDGGAATEPVMSALDRLYEREQRWAELDEVLEQELQICSDVSDVNRIRMRQGVIREREFGDFAGAIAAYRDVLESSPRNNEALAALEEMLAKDEFVADLVDVLSPAYETRDERHKIGALFDARLRVCSDDQERVQLLTDLAAHQELAMGDLQAAFDAVARAVGVAPEEERLLDELERLAASQGGWGALVEVSEKVLDGGRLDPQAQVQLALKIARWAATQVGDPRMAEAKYRVVLDRDPDHQEAIGALVELLRNLGRFEDLLPLLRRQAGITYEFEAKKEILFQAARVAQLELGDAAKAIQTYREILELDEADLDATDALIALTGEAQDFEAQVELLLSRARNTMDPAASNAFRHRAATLYVGPLASPERAVEVYREIADTDPADQGALEQLESLFGKLERWSDLQDLYLQKMGSASSDSERAEVLRGLAALSEQRFDAPDDAVGHLQEILMTFPGDDRAFADLERIFSKTERWQDLVELLESRADRAREAGDAAAELTLLVRIGEIWDSRLADPDRATGIYERVLERDPEHTRALAALARLYEANEDWDRVAEVLRKAAAAGRGGPDQAEVHFRLARLHESRLEDPDGAIAQLHKAVALHPGHLEANRALAGHCRARGDNEGLLEALMREEMHLAGSAEKIAMLLEIANLQAGPLADRAGAAASLERARDLDPGNRDVLLKLSDAYIDAGRQDDAIPVIEALINAETDGGKRRSKGAAVFHQRLAKAYLARGDQEKALENLEGAYKMDISNTEVLISLGKLHYQREDWDKAGKLFRALLLQKFDASAGASKADIYWYVGDISLKQGDPRKAKGMFQRGLDEDKDHADCKAGLAQC